MDNINELVLEGFNSEFGAIAGSIKGSNLAHHLGATGRDNPINRILSGTGQAIGYTTGLMHDHPFITAAGAAGLTYKYLKDKQKDQTQRMRGSQHTHSQHIRQK